MTLYGYKSPAQQDPDPSSVPRSPSYAQRRALSESLRSKPALNVRDELKQLKTEVELKESILANIKGETLTLRTTIQKFELQQQNYEETLDSLKKQMRILSNKLETLHTETVNNHNETLRNYELKEKEMRLENDTSMYNMEKAYDIEIERNLADKVGKIQEQKVQLARKLEMFQREIASDDLKYNESLNKLTAAMKQKEEKLRAFMIKERQELEDESTMLDVELQRVDKEIKVKKQEHANLKELEGSKRTTLKDNKLSTEGSTNKLTDIQQELQELHHYIKFTNEMIVNIQQDMARKRALTQSFDKLVLLEEDKRRKCHNKLQELKGNIRVFCRIRPSLKHELNEEELKVQVPDNDEVKQEIDIDDTKARPSSNGGIKKYNFKFDKVFQQHSTNSEIFEEISQLVQSTLYGFNVCIFAYGQTGSGKTFTMSNEDGIIPQTVTQIFDTCRKLEQRGFIFKIFGEFLQIYNESIMDLMNTTVDDIKYEIKHDQSTRQTYVTNLTRTQFTDPKEMNGTLQRALENRAVASTKSNERSSRSHTVCIIRIQVTNHQTNENYTSVLNLIDLAGSERISHSQVSGDRLKETQAINKSLSCLGDVIYALGDVNSKHVPFRNSKLTYLLQYSLLEDSKTLMFVNVSPLEKNLNETINSLRFATKVNNTGLQKKV